MVNSEVRAVGAQFLRYDRELDGLQQRIRARARPRVRAWAPVTEGQESDLLHAFSAILTDKQAGGRSQGRLTTRQAARASTSERASIGGDRPDPAATDPNRRESRVAEAAVRLACFRPANATGA